ncbi:IBR finger domain-containing protein [Magnaporthiopsis poae ATCC 64411]|uniref:RBR-type E3 ubiquitin transferase n=1 Tax=Magnaporthiopsis poae (strain ATCC 64411 / 73-15) TaxID=644358 RepID=A0A0C4DUX7_MAGP6|nr:IBR finger domain-containing protein [Magnaporthiopsis poae ATCC 64411]
MATLILNRVENETIALHLRLQLEDIRELECQLEGDALDGSPSDFRAALDAYKRELTTHLGLESDRAMALSISQAVRLDTPIINSHLEEEERATRDHQLALSLRDPRAEALPAARLLEAPPAVELTGSAPVADEPESAAEDSQKALVVYEAPKFKCICCGTTSAPNGGLRSPCAHEYCRDCLVQLFELALKDDSIFPPRCCRSIIPLDLSREFIGPDLAGRFLAKKLEMETPNRTYCHDPRCARFIPPQFVKADVGTCVSCGKKTCALCKAASHRTSDCPNDPRTKQLLALAEKKGWRQCNNCKKMVELTYGCLHMVCRCGAEFCYRCGLEWRTCSCA